MPAKSSATEEAAAYLFNHWKTASQPPKADKTIFKKKFFAYTNLTTSECICTEVEGIAWVQSAAVNFWGIDWPHLLPDNDWEWRKSSRSEARCAILRDGRLRICTPSPNSIEGLLLLAHELGHAVLERRSPGTLVQTANTEVIAMACEISTAIWLKSSACVISQNTNLTQTVDVWLQQRNFEFIVYHRVLAQFEWLCWREVQNMRSIIKPENIETLWQEAHEQHDAQAAAYEWTQHPLLLRRPGTANFYVNAWLEASRKFTKETCYAA